MKTVMEAISKLDIEEAKDLKLIAEQSFDCVRNVEELDERRERLYNILDLIIDTTKERIKEIAMKDLETI